MHFLMFFKNTFVFPLKQISIFIIDAFEYSGEKVMMTKWPKFLHKLFSSEMSIYMQTVILVSADVFFIHTCIYIIGELEVLFFCCEIIMKRFSAFSSSLRRQYSCHEVDVYYFIILPHVLIFFPNVK